MAKQIIVRTEVWRNGNGIIVKAVVRNSDGTFVGATNQTGVIHPEKVTLEVIGK